MNSDVDTTLLESMSLWWSCLLMLSISLCY